MKSTEPSSVFSRLGLSWPLVVGLMFSIWALVTTSTELLGDPDTYLHISIGRWILLHHTVPEVDVFSYTKLGDPWIAHEWLAGVILALCHQWTGWGGLVLLAILCWAATLAYLMRYLLAHLEPVHALLLTAIAGASLMANLLVRPHVLAWPLLAIWVGQLIQAVENRHPPKWWLLPIMVLWANLHGGFTLGLALMFPPLFEAVFAAPRQSRWRIAKPWLVFMAAALLAAMLTPSGWHGIWFTVQIMQLQHLKFIQEWMPPKDVVLWFLEGWIFLLLLLGLYGRLRVSLWRLLPLLGLIHLGLAHMRNVSVFALLAPFLLATSLGQNWYANAPQAGQAETLDKLFRSMVPKARWWTVLFTGLLIGSTMIFLDRDGRYQPASKITPDKALLAAQAAGAKGRVLNDYGFGGFLVFKTVPVFVDGRADLYGDIFLEKYAEAFNTAKPEVMPQLLDAYRVNWTLLQAGSPAARRMDSLPGWQRIHADEIAVVHQRNNVIEHRSPKDPGAGRNPAGKTSRYRQGNAWPWQMGCNPADPENLSACKT